MPKRDTLITPDNIYHIYNRGVNKELIFFSDRNYQYFINQMQKYLPNTSDLVAYCLMPNHFHLLVKVNSDAFVNKSLQPLLMSYSLAINKEQDRVGPLFQGRYKNMLIDDERYILDCMKYIHLNPVKANLVKAPELWKYSSYRNYLYANKNSVINGTIILDYFDNLTEFQEFHEVEINLAKDFFD